MKSHWFQLRSSTSRHISSTSGFITSVEQAKQFWNDWSPWTVTEDVFELTTEAQVDAFLQIAEKNKL